MHRYIFCFVLSEDSMFSDCTFFFFFFFRSPDHRSFICLPVSCTWKSTLRNLSIVLLELFLLATGEMTIRFFFSFTYSLFRFFCSFITWGNRAKKRTKIQRLFYKSALDTFVWMCKKKLWMNERRREKKMNWMWKKVLAIHLCSSLKYCRF